MAAGQIIRTKEIGTVLISLAGEDNIKLHNIALTPGYDSNLISLGYLHESKIIYHNNPAVMILMRNGKVIARAKRDQNLFTLNLAQPGKAMTVINKKSKAMAITRWRQPTHLVSQNKCIRLWHYQLAHVSNARVVKASRLVDGINFDIGKEYNPTEVLVDSNDSDTPNASDHEDLAPDNTGITHELAPNNIGITPDTVAHQTTDIDVLDKLCMPFVGNKSTRTIKRDKSMTIATSKLEKCM